MRKVFVILAFLAIAASALAQSSAVQEVRDPDAESGTHINEIWFDMRASFHQQWEQGVYDTHFQGEYFNFHLTGQLTDNLTFRLRQRLNRKIDNDNPFSATDFMWLTWHAMPKLSFTFGKQAIMIGGYEIDSAPIDVYYYGAFSNRLYQYYAFGATATFMPAPGQAISLQFIPSPISPVTQNAYSYNMYWNGHVLPWWKTIWSYNLVEDELHRKMNWLALGNKFDMGKLVVDVDFIDRFAFGQKNMFSDWSAIVKAILTLDKWNLCTKVGYERNDASNIDPNWKSEWDDIVAPTHRGSYDLVLPAGNDYFYYGAGVEFFPLGNEKLRFHFAYFGDNHDRIHNLDIGLMWKFSAYKRKK
jgi:hypothetical protein